LDSDHSVSQESATRNLAHSAAKQLRTELLEIRLLLDRDASFTTSKGPFRMKSEAASLHLTAERLIIHCAVRGIQREPVAFVSAKQFS
jgi:hypothetical protein